MRANPLVCVETDQVVSAHQWTSVIVFGRYEELRDSPESRSECELAWNLLKQHAMRWEPGYAKTIVGGKTRSLAPVFYRIHVAQVTGRRTAPEAVPADIGLPRKDADESGALQKVLRLVQGRFRQ